MIDGERLFLLTLVLLLLIVGFAGPLFFSTRGEGGTVGPPVLEAGEVSEELLGQTPASLRAKENARRLAELAKGWMPSRRPLVQWRGVLRIRPEKDWPTDFDGLERMYSRRLDFAQGPPFHSIVDGQGGVRSTTRWEEQTRLREPRLPGESEWIHVLYLATPPAESDGAKLEQVLRSEAFSRGGLAKRIGLKGKVVVVSHRRDS